MLKDMLTHWLAAFERQWGYDASYLHDVNRASPASVIKFMLGSRAADSKAAPPEALAPVPEQPLISNAERAVIARIQIYFWNPRCSLHPLGGDISIEIILYWRLPQSYSYAPGQAKLRKG